MPGRYSRCRSIRVTATMRPASPASCRPAGLRRCASRTSIATRLGRCWRAGRCWSKSSVISRTRGLLKNVGLVIGRAKFNVFAVRAEELIENRPELIAVVEPLLKARKAIEQQTDDLDRKVLKLARHDAQVRRFMTVPGVGPITALCFKATIDDPTRFKRSRSVGAYVGLTTRRHASGETDWTGRISKCGDAMLRSYLFEAAGVLLTRVPKWSALRAWGMRLAKRNGLRKAKVAVARKLAVILHRMWIDGTEFNWSKKEVAAYRANEITGFPQNGGKRRPCRDDGGG